jgi:hypothetical protein
VGDEAEAAARRALGGERCAVWQAAGRGWSSLISHRRGAARRRTQRRTAGGILVKPKGSFAKSTLFTRSRPLIRAIRRMWAARDVAFCGDQAWTQDSYRLRVTWPSVVTKLGLSGWDQLCTSLDQLLINLLLGRVFTILRQFDYAFLLR